MEGLGERYSLEPMLNVLLMWSMYHRMEENPQECVICQESFGKHTIIQALSLNVVQLPQLDPSAKRPPNLKKKQVLLGADCEMMLIGRKHHLEPRWGRRPWSLHKQRWDLHGCTGAGRKLCTRKWSKSSTITYLFRVLQKAKQCTTYGSEQYSI